MSIAIESIPIAQIRPAPYNPRIDLQPGDGQYQRLERSLSEFGCVEPLVWNRRTGHLVGGHQRLKVLSAQGATAVDVSVVDLPLEREQALNVALNKITGDWDEERLAALLTDLARIPEFDVGLTGFDGDQIGALLDRLQSNSSDDTFDIEAALAAARAGPAITQRGELIELHAHRLLCGDSSRPADVARICPPGAAELLFTDPPYNVDYYGGARPSPQHARPKPSRRWSRIYNDNLSQPQYEAWLGRVLRHGLTALRPGATFYIWNGHRQFGPMHARLTRAGAHVAAVITWAKERFAIGYGDYQQQTEFCLYGWKPGPGGHRWYGPANETTLWQIARDPTHSYVHPTQKPLALAERAQRNSSRRGESVLDLFLGSGTTLIAAERLGRRCLGIEIDPHYCDVIVRRWLSAIGDQAPADLVQRYGRVSAESAP